MLGLLGSAMAGGAQAVSQVSEGRIEEKRAKALEKLRTMNTRETNNIQFERNVGRDDTLNERRVAQSDTDFRRQSRRDEMQLISAKGLADTKFVREKSLSETEFQRKKEIEALKLVEGGSGDPAAWIVFKRQAAAAGLQEGTTEYENAAMVALGTKPRASLSAAERIAVDEVLSTQVAASSGEEAGARETAKLESQLATKPAVEAAVTTARVTAENQAKSMSPEAQSAERMKVTSAQGVIAQIENLTNSDDYMKAIAGVRGKLPPVPGTPGFDAEVAFNQFKDSLTLENLDKMSGVLTDKDIQLLSSAASGLELGMSRKALEDRMSIIKSVLEDQSAAAKGKLEGMMGGSASTGGATGIMNMSADQIQSLNPADLSEQELKQAADRYNQLGGQ